MMYTSIHDIPTNNYFKCLYGNYKYMFKDLSGKVTDEVIEKFEVIKSEFDIEMNDYSAKEMRMKFISVLKKRKEIALLESLILLLSVRPKDEELISVVHKMRYRYDIKDTSNSIKKLEGECRNLKNLTKSILLEIKKDTTTEFNEYTLIQEIEKHRKHSIDTNKVVIAQFIAYIKDYKKEVKAQQSKK